jgi:ferredoxin
MKLKVDYKKCEKAGECYYNHTSLFDRIDNGFPKILVEDLITDAQRHEAEEAIEVCPTGAITIEE